MVGEQRSVFGHSGQYDSGSRVLAYWTSECQTLDGYWYAKRLSANDTQANGSHQAGPYVPRDIAFRLFPELQDSADTNPRSSFRAVAGSHSCETECNVIWYRGGTRNETRITGWGGKSSPLLDPDNTGAIALLFFTEEVGRRECRYWVCRNGQEEDEAEAFTGPVEPGMSLFWTADGDLLAEADARQLAEPCWIEADQLPEGWLETFPSTQAVFDKAIELASYRNLDIDERMVRRRECEYSVFRSVEYVDLSQAIQGGFQSAAHFLTKAQSVLQRRKSRSGRSLELQVRTILNEEDVKHTPQPTVESNNRPDFIFPSQADYANPVFPVGRLRMLGCKTTVKERWEQVVGEADRISLKHLFTLQEGVSENQYDKMKNKGVCLVVPRSLHSTYPPSVRAELMSLEDFVNETKGL